MEPVKGSVAIGCAAGFWGDSQFAARKLLGTNALDYLIFDYLAETTMALLAQMKSRQPAMGYAPDFIEVITPLLKNIAKQRVKIVTNAGGLNPRMAQELLTRKIAEAGLELKVGTVRGDDLLGIANREPSESKKFIALNAYLGADGIREALAMGCDIVITGRVVDSALALGPLLYEFGWQMDDYDRLAQGSLAGHLIECGAQCTGGISTDWLEIPDPANIGYPIVECFQDGSFIVTKPTGSGGKVDLATVAEQLLYEVGDPSAYQLPDVTVDLRQVSMEPIGKDQVKVTGARGYNPTNTLKVCGFYVDGCHATTLFLVTGMQAPQKARRVADAILKRVNDNLKEIELPPITEYDVNIYSESSNNELSSCPVRVAVAHPSKQVLEIFCKEIAQAGTAMSPGLCALTSGRPKPVPRIRMATQFLNKDCVTIKVSCQKNQKSMRHAHFAQLNQAEGDSPIQSEPEIDIADPVTVPLIKIAWARSGDKGDDGNIGVIARRPDVFPYINQTLTLSRVKDYFQEDLTHPGSEVIKYTLPKIHALNFVLKHSLGGGSLASLKPDSQGKAMAQRLLAMPVPIPKKIAETIA